MTQWNGRATLAGPGWKEPNKITISGLLHPVYSGVEPGSISYPGCKNQTIRTERSPLNRHSSMHQG